ncbi:methyltransferase domain-containing protein [Nocardia sp. R7R-8]|uniref:methyltransferase domain-containing protein n=1 Tax=Nocardia sp. R7R-8 TaxID=3459304 RepID=UPI00403DB4F5
MFALQAANVGPGGPCTSVVDVACGIGAACEYFATTGLRTIGVDASPEMLEQARNSAKNRGQQIDYIEQDMRHLSVATKVDLVTCMYDSLNFMLVIDDLEQAFDRARRALRDGGHYVFDMYTPRGLAEVWASVDQVHTMHPEHFVATRTAWNPQQSTNTKTLWGFDLIDGQWHHWTEQHTIRAYPFDETEKALRTAGFQLLRAVDWARPQPKPVSESTTRIAFVARAN